MSQTHAKEKKDGGGLSVGKAGYFSLFGRFGFGKGKSGSSLSEKQTAEKKENTVRYRPDYSKPTPPINWDALDAMTEDDIQAIIDADPDCAEPTDEEWEKAIRDVRV